MLAPLVASIAARNVTIVVAAEGEDDIFLSFLSQVWPKYLDADCNLLVKSFQDCQEIKDVEMISVYGKIIFASI